MQIFPHIFATHSRHVGDYRWDLFQEEEQRQKLQWQLPASSLKFTRAQLVWYF